MALRKMSTYMDEDLLRAAKVHAARSDVKIYEVINEALRRYLEEAGGSDTPAAGEPLSGAVLADRRGR